ncbi:argininosuccinate lyase [Candidatus Vidania fulgoroideorum]
MIKKWSKRFNKKISYKFIKYTSSIDYDKKLIKEEIAVLMAHAKMLKKIKILSTYELSKIIKGLKYLEKNKKIKYDIFLEDLHLNVENLLIKKIGNVGKKIRIARSRNDLITTDLKIWMKKKIIKLFLLLKKLIIVFLKISKKNYKTILPGFTHFQIAQPVTLGHHFIAYCEMFKRDLIRLKNTYNLSNYLPLGCCALAGTNFDLDRLFLSTELKFKYICRNSIDAVSDRDYVLDFLFFSSMLMMHISRISEEIILWSNSCLNFVEISDDMSSGSSIMPQKKNPDSLEVMRSKFGRITGNLFSFFLIMKALPLAYNKDYQEDKKLLFENYKIVKDTIILLILIIKKIKINKKKMFSAAGKNFSYSTDLADYISKLGLSFKDSHSIVSNLVKKCINEKKNLKNINISDLKKILNKKKYYLLKRNLKFICNAKNSVYKKISIGGTSPFNVLNEINIFKKMLKKYNINGID